MIKRLLIFLLLLSQVSAGPVIWGPQQRSKVLTGSGFSLSNGMSIDYDGEINAIKNGNAEVDTSGWATYADAAATTPVDGTGGSANVTIAQTTTAGQVIRGNASFLLAKDAANRQGQGWSYAFSIDRSDVNKKLKIQFNHKFSSANYDGSTEKISVYIYDVTNASLITPSSTDVIGSTSDGGSFVSTFSSSSSTSYRLILHISGTGTSAWDAYVDGFIVGPGIQPQGAVAEEWKSFAPTGNGLGTLSNIDIRFAREGTNITILGRFTTGTTTHVEARLNLPNGLTSGVTNLDQIVGVFYRSNSSANTTKNGVALASPSQGYIKFSFDDRVDTKDPFSPQFADDIFASNNTYGFSIKLPIAEWAGSGVVNLAQNDVEFLSNSSTSVTNDTTSFVYGPNGSPMPNGAAAGSFTKRIRLQSPRQQTDKFVFEVSYQNGAWFPLIGEDTATGLSGGVLQNGVEYGVGIRGNNINSTDIDIGFGRYAITGATFGGAGTDWSNSVIQNYRWRVRKIASGAAVGFGKATQSSSGLVTSYAPTIKSSILSLSSANYTVLDNDGYEAISVSTGASDRTITLPTLADNIGRRLKIIKSDSGAGNVIVDGEGSEAISGQATITLVGQYAALVIVGDSSGWLIESWTGVTNSYTPSTNGLGTVSFAQARYNISSGMLHVFIRMTVGTVTAAEARIGLPGGLVAPSGLGSRQLVGRFYRNDSTGNAVKGGVVNVVGGNAYVNLSFDEYVPAVNADTAQNGSAIFNSSDVSSMHFSIPLL